jgi:alanine racemase
VTFQLSTLDSRPPARALIDLDAIASNYRLLQGRVGPQRAVYAVVKANAYGHGAPEVARHLERQGADRFAVAGTEEGVALRRAGVKGEILLLSHAEPADLPRQRAYGLTPTLSDLAQARAVIAASRTLSRRLPVQLELDTGMGRSGIRPEELNSLIAALKGAPLLTLAGTFANLSAADDPASPETGRQVAAMEACLSRLRDAGVKPGLVHVANSAGILAHSGSWLDAVRPGLALYGVAPSEAIDARNLTPAMTLETNVIGVRRVPAGTPLGYGGRFVTARETTVAVLPIGYHDGFRRSFSGRVEVLLRGSKAPVVGSVSMDVTLIDATGTGAARGDRVVCLGRDGAESVTAWDLARAAGTIPYEILCGIGSRVDRVYSGSAMAP